jgi:hypothetical protein
VNVDTVGRLGSQPVSVLGASSAQEWPFIFGGITAATGIPTRIVAGAGESSDQRAFIEAGLPGVQLFTSATLDYHRPTDTADKVDGAGLVQVATVTTEAIVYLASTDRQLTVTGDATPAAPPGERRRVSLGTIPDFAWRGPGLRLDGVVPGSPADKAGMKSGDFLMTLGGEAVIGLESFNDILKKHQPGDRVELHWTREGQATSATVDLVAR